MVGAMMFLFRGIGGNVHPGAARYYEEQGMTVPGK